MLECDAKLSNWYPCSWMNYPTTHLPDYADQSTLDDVLTELNARASLIKYQSIHELFKQLENVQQQAAFIIQAGDCAEVFSEINHQSTTDKLTLLRQLQSQVESTIPSVTIGRLAGQFAKPRTCAVEIQDGMRLPSYFGDMVNGFEFSETIRAPDPKRLLQAYDASMSVLSLLNENNIQYQSPRLFASHEGLNLFYEAGLTRQYGDHWYCSSTHFPWIGMRTAMNSMGHIRFFQGLSNPIAIKLGPKTSLSHLDFLLEALNPTNQAGKITLVHRLGVDEISAILPRWIHHLQDANRQVIWVCDPMHGNTKLADSGYKIRYLDDIMNEVEHSFALHRQHGSFLGGIHLEVSHADVTECVDFQTVTFSNLSERYLTKVDPRLNPQQAKQVLRLVTEQLKQH